MITTYANSRDKQQAGMVAIMVTLILMIVISLIVIGFAQISRRNQRQALDRQLSTQAFYAAETGVNDANNLIKTAIGLGNIVAAKPNCASNGGGFYSSLNNGVIDDASGVRYTCLMVDPTPSTLSYSSIGGTSTIVPLISGSGGTIASVSMTWQSKDETSTPTANCPISRTNVFSPTTSWNCGYGVLRFDLVPTSGSLTADGLKNATMTSFVVPLSASGDATVNPIDYTTGGGRNLLGVVCTNTSCSLTIRGLTQNQYYLRVSSIYKDVSLQITAADGAAAPIALQGAQAVVDATGKAQDVLRRIQVRVSLTGSSTNMLSDYGIQSSEAICKRFSVMDNFFLSDSNNAVPGVGGTTTNPLCKTP